MAMITLLTDFGLQDEYVGVLKGVILSTDPEAVIVDISHGIDPQDVIGAAHMLKAAYPYFPKGAIHLAVVDPGVGTRRGIIAARAHGHLFVGPDNGLLEPILGCCPTVSIHRIENADLFRQPVSRTFHGRDIMAPVAAHLSKEMDLTAVGPAMTVAEIEPLTAAIPRRIGSQGIEGQIVAVDRFGNLITNIEVQALKTLSIARPLIVLGEHKIHGLTQTYARTDSDRPAAIVGSRNTIEIAVNRGRADRILGKGKGALIRVSADQP